MVNATKEAVARHSPESVTVRVLRHVSWMKPLRFQTEAVISERGHQMVSFRFTPFPL